MKASQVSTASPPIFLDDVVDFDSGPSAHTHGRITKELFLRMRKRNAKTKCYHWRQKQGFTGLHLSRQLQAARREGIGPYENAHAERNQAATLTDERYRLFTESS